MSKELGSACSPGATCPNKAASIWPMAVQRHRHSVRMYGAIAGAWALLWLVHDACMVGLVLVLERM